MFADNFKRLAKTNTNFRKVLHTGQFAQVVAMSIPINGDIGEETHHATDQLFIVAEGDGEAEVGSDIHALGEQDLLFVPAGTIHNIKNIGDESLKLITIYAPPAHQDGTVHTTKEEALLAEGFSPGLGKHSGNPL